MIGIVRGLLTLALMSSFIGLVVWAWNSARQDTFDAIARLPLEDDTVEGSGSKRV